MRHMIGSTAEATLFQFAVTLIIHNVMRLIQAHVSEAQNTSPEELSLPKLIRTAKKQMVSLTVFVPAGRTAELILSRDPTPARVAQMLGRLWDDDWIKARRKKIDNASSRQEVIGRTHICLPGNPGSQNGLRCLERWPRTPVVDSDAGRLW